MRLKTKDMTLVAMFTALTAIGAQLSLPTEPVPFTLQVLFCMYSGIFLGAKRGAMSQIIYVAIGLIGVPVFAGFKGGIQWVVSPTFGYLLGFIACSYVIGKIVESFKELNMFKIALSTVVGLAVVYVIGVPYLYLILNKVADSPITFKGAITAGFTGFIVQDLIKCAIVTVSSVAIIPALRKSGYFKIKDEAVN